jgi:hypothetical protein
MAITGNKGEWSEAYAFLRLLADGRLFAADERLERLEHMYFPIIKIFREDVVGVSCHYCPDTNNGEVQIFENDVYVSSLPIVKFSEEADSLLLEINASKPGKGTFDIPNTEAFLKTIFVNKLKARSSGKSDISIQLHDIRTTFEQIVGFSIKSGLGGSPTLLNASKTTNFVYKVQGLDRKRVEEINNINTPKYIKDRMTAISRCAKLLFQSTDNSVFTDNLMMIDSQMPKIIAEMLIGYFFDNVSRCVELVDYVGNKDPLGIKNPNFYQHKIKDLLCAVALGMKPSFVWDGTDEASGGYIVVKSNGEVLAYHIYNRDAFKSYLLRNTKFETASSSRFKFGRLYEQNDEIRIKLNLDIRFI